MTDHAAAIRRVLKVHDGSEFTADEFPSLEDGKAASAALDALEAELEEAKADAEWYENQYEALLTAVGGVWPN